MPFFALMRLAGVLWIFGFLMLAAIATSSYLFSTEEPAARGARWTMRLKMALVWPIALLSRAGRARLRNG